MQIISCLKKFHNSSDEQFARRMTSEIKICLSAIRIVFKIADSTLDDLYIFVAACSVIVECLLAGEADEEFRERVGHFLIWISEKCSGLFDNSEEEEEEDDDDEIRENSVV